MTSHNWNFTALPPIQPDPIFAITAEAIAAGPEAINGTIGVYMDEQGKPLLFDSVKKALTELGEKLPSLNYSYPPLSGLPEFRSAINNLLFDQPKNLHIAGIAATAGTGALAMNLRLARLMQPGASVILQMPAWVNHPPVCEANFLHITQTQYLDARHKPDTVHLEMACEDEPDRPKILLLQVGCHNPTGLDFEPDQWKHIVNIAKKHDCLVILDFAYQGFKSKPEDERGPINVFLESGLPLLISWSASKNHSIYGMRTGYACAVAPDDKTRANLDILYSRISRGMHSAAPTFGQTIVALVQQKYQKEWKIDLKNCREMMAKKRQLMIEQLPESFHAALSGYGMFAMLPLTQKQILTLKDQKVFLATDGRLNIGGIPLTRIEEMCEKITEVVK